MPAGGMAPGPGGESGWFYFGFRWAGGAEGGPEPLSAEGLGPVRRVRPSWSFAAVVAASEPVRVRLQGAVAAGLPRDCLDALPSETHVLLVREAALEAWPTATAPDALLDGRPVWRRELRAEEAAAIDAGDLYLWGWNEAGQLGLPSKKASEVAAAAAEEVGSAPRNRPLCERSVSSDGERLDVGDAPFVSVQPFPALLDLPEEAEVRRVCCGSRHTAAVTGAGHLYTWGWGKYGQLGHQDAATCDQPRRVCYFVERNLRVQDVVCGPWTTFAQAAAAKSGP